MKKTLFICFLLIPALALGGCGLFGRKYAYRKLSDGTVEITKYNGKAEVLEIPSQLDGKTVTSIGTYAFSDCNSLRSVTIPGSVKNIGELAFLFCRNLTSVTLGKGVTKIGDSAFSNCRVLTSVTIPDGVTDIGDHAFYICEMLTSITLPYSVKHIGKDAFSVQKTGNGSFTAPIEGLTVSLQEDSYAEQYCRENGIKYVYSD